MKENKLLRATAIVSCLIGLLIILYGGVKNHDEVSQFRALDFIQSILIFNFIILVFLPDKKLFNIAFIIGILTVIIDFFLETIAFYLNWWYPLGGIQYPPIIVVPLEMVFGFFFVGASMGIIITFPEKFREIDFKLLNWLKPLFKNEKADWFWRILLILVNAIIGTHGDYSAGPQIWAPGPLWHPIFTFIVWFGGGVVTLYLYYYFDKKL